MIAFEIAGEEESPLRAIADSTELKTSCVGFTPAWVMRLYSPRARTWHREPGPEELSASMTLLHALASGGISKSAKRAMSASSRLRVCWWEHARLSAVMSTSNAIPSSRTYSSQIRSYIYHEEKNQEFTATVSRLYLTRQGTLWLFHTRKIFLTNKSHSPSKCFPSPQANDFSTT